MRINDELLLFVGPRRFDYLRVEVIVPSFATLLTNAPVKVLCNDGPFLRAVLVDKVDDFLVLLGKERKATCS